uniref:C4-dicarboxylate transporter DcuC n=1 Tax=Massilibacillus massiliensis TaxID=1806837 RepID=UPI0022770ADE|nr:C4-dicarboxylate transporter DcuC [Massilibacillus massiliensis]
MIVSLLVTIWVGYLITKKYKPQPVLFFAGMILMLSAVVFGYGQILSEKESTGFIFFDMFEFIKNTFSSRAAALGLNIMAVGGFARYMEHVGASKALVHIAIQPLSKLHAPYTVMSVSWVLGMCLGLFINSASGLAMLLMVTMFPILVNLGVSRISACAVIATTLCMDWSPADPGSILSATTAGLDIATYWTQYQVPVTIAVLIAGSISHFFTQRYFDRRENHIVERSNKEKITTEVDLPPRLYALLPMIPLVLILSFSDLWISWIKMDLIKAMFIGLFITMICEYIRYKDAKKVCADIQVFFDGLGMQMANVVTLIVAGETFAKGLTSMGTIDAIINSAQNSGFGGIGMVLVMVAIIGFSAIIMGSGNAPFFAFASLTPVVAAKMGMAPVLMLMPMHFAASIARCISPITAVIVVTASLGNISPFDLIKRTAIPMIIAMIVMVLTSLILFH